MAKKKSLSLITIILLAVAAVGMILTIVGPFMDWVKYSAETIVGSSAEGFTLSDLSDQNVNLEKLNSGFEMFGAMNAFAYITMVLAIVSVVAAALSKFLKMKLLKPIAGIAGILTLLSTVLLIIFTCMFCSKNGSVSLGGLGSGSFKWAVGSVLAVIGGFISGLASMASYKY